MSKAIITRVQERYVPEIKVLASLLPIHRYFFKRGRPVNEQRRDNYTLVYNIMWNAIADGYGAGYNQCLRDREREGWDA